MRENEVPCTHATLYELSQGKHMTWNDDCICSPCRRLLDRFERTRVEAQEMAEYEAEYYESHPVEVADAEPVRPWHPSMGPMVP